MKRQQFEFAFESTTDVVLVDSTEEADTNKRVVFALHGWGQSGDRLVTHFESAIAEWPALWVFPNGFHHFEAQAGRRIGNAWYLFDGDQDGLRKSMMESVTRIRNLAGYISVKHEIPLKDWDIVGFSQGGYTCGVVASHAPEIFKRACCIGGRFKYEFFGQIPADQSLNLLQIHGDQDQSVPVDLARDAVEKIKELGIPCEFQSIPGVGHKLTPEVVAAYLHWLKEGES